MPAFRPHFISFINRHPSVSIFPSNNSKHILTQSRNLNDSTISTVQSSSSANFICCQLSTTASRSDNQMPTTHSSPSAVESGELLPKLFPDSSERKLQQSSTFVSNLTDTYSQGRYVDDDHLLDSKTFHVEKCGDAILTTVDRKCGPWERQLRFGDAVSLQSKIDKLTLDGPNNLQFIVDFDQTLTRTICPRTGERRIAVSWSVVEDSDRVSADYRRRCQALKAHYLPIEQNVDMTSAEKEPHLIEWFQRSTSILSESGLNRNMLPDMVNRSSVTFRDGVATLFRQLYEAQIPVLILSAGLGDIVHELLRQHSMLTDNIRVVANFLQYDDQDGSVTGLKPDRPLIHVFNKNEATCLSSSPEDDSFRQQITSRHNVILMGDSLGDLTMASCVEQEHPSSSTVLKVGFLNWGRDSPSKIQHYVDGFDIVLIDDQTVDVPRRIVDQILSS